MRSTFVFAMLCLAMLGLFLTAPMSWVQAQGDLASRYADRNELKISVLACSPSPCTPDQPVKFGEVLNNQTPTIAIAITSNFDCAGQVALTTLGAPGYPPEVGILTSPGLFTIGPDVVPPYGNGNSVTTLPITLGVLPNGTNAFKISASCNGAKQRQYGFAVFDFSIG